VPRQSPDSTVHEEESTKDPKDIDKECGREERNSLPSSVFVF